MKIQLNKSFFMTIALLIATAALAYYSALWRMKDAADGGDSTAKKAPLYWVAPMDPNYQRDKPGKSPMGMDLIPVYEEAGGDQEIGTVTISPDVVNNLGVRTAPVTRGPMNVSVNTVGYVQYDEDHLIHIHPRVEGWIEKLYIKAAGDPVEQGAPLYALYSPTLVNAQEELLLALKRNNVALIDAAMERLASLQVPESEIKRLKKSGKVSQTITISAPQSGVLENLMVREGMFVKPGMEIMAIGQLEHIWVIGEIFERQASLVQVGDRVHMQLDYLPRREWQGKVDYVYPSLNATTRTAQVRVHFNNPDGYLKPGMFAQMRIETAPMHNIVLIPREALIRTGSQARVVLAKGAGRFKSVTVQVGHITDDQAEITSGLDEGDRIVTSAQFLIDSESSKTSDFRRMSHGSDDKAETVAPTSVWVGAQIKSLMAEHRMLTLAHEAIDDWQWPAMTMDFIAQKNVDLEGLNPGMTLHVEITKEGDDHYVISQIHRPEAVTDDMPTTDSDPSMDHSQHQSMNHDGMEMDHSQHNGVEKP
ncbi:efflux RND transporter periplasmic adaptor subunit [Aestuariicella hydrocarbonica]|uniref:Efflux RND transporter periplasmic adaptor subunit n=1 Tax=Pseudomaricurvus hydrocarbonicus TaxID=1470433 RepID=A0A9E5JSW9_9GAMM|nr:efflux RND transporter periplasmic adaptor subunit [Aestuariicella hydrocarbonica]NHO63956.1 efflux RND transporter periplasmic adaptor subunit [Aestuariicella hydrocarbonica]